LTTNLRAFNGFQLESRALKAYFPRNREELAETVSKHASGEIVPIGFGKNTLLMESLYRNRVFIILGGQFAETNMSDTTLTASGGCSLKSLAETALKNSLSGLEYFWDIPGTLGGAIFMNAGAYGKSICDLLQSVEVMNLDTGSTRRIGSSNIVSGYRYSSFQQSRDVIVSASLALSCSSQDSIRKKMIENRVIRRDKIPYDLPNVGSIFKRPQTGDPVGAMVEKLGLKGYILGGAQISLLHGGVIVNRGNAVAQDILGLIDLVRDRVLAAFGLELKLEVRVIYDSHE
jgi:UDP-N-acetylmuramate dehydrogenase